VLRPFRALDADFYADFYAELIAERGPRGRWFGATVDGARRIIWRNAEAGKRSGLGLLAIRRRKEGDLIGYCGLIAGTAGIDQPEIAYEFLRRAHGHGYATEAAMAVIDAAAATGRHRLWSTVRIWNAPSFRVLQKTGFRRDHSETEEQGGDTVYLVRDLQAGQEPAEPWSASGIEAVKVLPTSTSDVACSVPPMLDIRRCDRARPTPVPSTLVA